MAESFDELTVRRERLAALRAANVNPYPSTSSPTHSIGEVINGFDTLAEAATAVTICGRLTARRAHGGSTFFVVDDSSGQLQVYAKSDELGEAAYASLDLLDVADFVECTGTLFITKRGEKTLLLSRAPTLLTKTLRPLPEKWHGLSDVETRYRQRYLDLIANPEARRAALIRIGVVREMRRFLEDRGYLEVETPMLQSIPGGATARPFITHLNALDIDLYLRIATELPLKQLVVGGFNKVFELGRIFRNEGIDHDHNPEFTSIEFYEAYIDYKQMMQLLEELLMTLASKVLGSLTLQFQGNSINLQAPYAVYDWVETINQALGIDVEALSDTDLRRALEDRNIELLPSDGRGAMLDQAYKKMVRPNIIQPTFLIDHPIELSPLAKRHRSKPGRVERFQLVLGGGIELMNGFSELNDPIDQRERFMEQERLRAAGDEEAQRIDEEFLEALEHGMPPTSGVGIGIDRLAALFSDHRNLKEVILFPTLRPKQVDLE